MGVRSSEADFRIGEVLVRPKRFELVRDGRPTRVEPKAMGVLLHLAGLQGEVATRHELLAAVWQDVHVGEDVLTRAVSLLRRALGDDLARPRFIETIRGGGYRWVVEKSPVAAEEPSAARAPASDAPDAALPGATRQRWLPRLGLALALVAATSLVALRGSFRPPPAVRVAVMPFEPSLDSSALAPSNDLAESIVRKLWEVESPSMEVVGPTTTQLYDGRPQRLRQLVEDFDLDYVVNGRDTVSERGPRVLLEIIRAGDGAHVWVRYLDEMADADVAETVAQATAGAAAGGVP